MRVFIFILSATLVFATAAKSQKVRLGIVAGPHSSIFLFGSEGAGANSSYLQKYSVHAGIVADLSIQPSFSIQPQLLFVLKGGKLPSGGEFEFSAIDLPINLLYRHNGFFGGLGPNFSYLLSGKLRTTGGEVADLFKDESFTNSITVKRLEIGINTLIGYEFAGGFLISANYAAGLNSIFESKDNAGANLLAHNSYFGFSFGYMFQGKGK
jgi:hypothetical protein